MNVNSCQFFRVSGFYLLLDAAFVAIALVQSSAMFKLSQFSPDADRVDLGRVACFFLPDSLRQGCHAKPGESKALFMTFFYVFFWTWVVSVAQVLRLIQMVIDHAADKARRGVLDRFRCSLGASPWRASTASARTCAGTWRRARRPGWLCVTGTASPASANSPK